MQTHDSDNMSDLERRLSALKPSSVGLNTDAMLFAAGQAAGRAHPGRFVWPAMTGLMSVAVMILGVMLTHEHSQRILLVQRLQERTPAATSVPSFPSNAAPAQSPESEQLSPDSLRVARRALEQGLDGWPLMPVAKSDPSRLSSGETFVLNVGQLDKLLEQ